MLQMLATRSWCRTVSNNDSMQWKGDDGRDVDAYNLGNIFLGGWEDLDVHDGGLQIRPPLRQLIKLSRARVVHFGLLGEVCHKLSKVGETAGAVDGRGSCNNSPGDSRRQQLGLGPAHRCDWPQSVVSIDRSWNIRSKLRDIQQPRGTVIMQYYTRSGTQVPGPNHLGEQILAACHHFMRPTHRSSPQASTRMHEGRHKANVLSSSLLSSAPVGNARTWNIHRTVTELYFVASSSLTRPEPTETFSWNHSKATGALPFHTRVGGYIGWAHRLLGFSWG